MGKAIHLVRRARLQIRDEWAYGALCGQMVNVSLRYDSPMPENATEDPDKATCRRCLSLMRSPSPRDRAQLKSKVSNAPDFGETWKEREAIAEKTAGIDFGCDFKGNTCIAMRENHRGCCCQRCSSRHGFLEKLKPSAVNEILSLFDRTWGFWRPGEGCILPRKWRSATCLFFACLPFIQEKDRHDLVQISTDAGNPQAISDALAGPLMDVQMNAH